MRLPIFLLACLGSVSAEAATITRYTERDDFLASISRPQVEDFSDGALIDGLSIQAQTSAISGGAFYGLVRPTRAALFTFDEPIFGFSWLIRSGGINMLSLTFLLADGTQQTLSPVSSTTSYRFQGFSSDEAIKSVSVFTPQSQVQFYLDELVLGASPTPEPASWAMMLCGFGAIGGLLRRRVARPALA
jgi:hypothetical protein